MFGDVPLLLHYRSLPERGGAHRVSDLGDGNNVQVGIIRSRTLRAVLLPTGVVHRLDGSGLFGA